MRGLLPFETVLSHFEVKHRSNGTAQALCPAHDDSTASLTISKANHGGTVFKCHAECETEDVIERAGLTWADVQPDDDWQRPERPRKPAPAVFWTQAMRDRLKAAQERLKAEPDHPLVRIAEDRDGIDHATLVQYGCGLFTESTMWLAFPYPTGVQLYRRVKGEKIIISVKGSKPRESFFGVSQLGEDVGELIIAKSGRETMLLSQYGASVIGLPGGERKELEPEQAHTLREIAPKSVRVVMDCDTDKALETSRAFAQQVAEALHPVPVALANVHAATDGRHKDVTDVDAAGEDVAAALSHYEVQEVQEVQGSERENGTAEGREVQKVQSALGWIPFPTADLPEGVSTFVEAQADALDCDETFVALPALAVMGAGVGNSFEVELKPSWKESSIIWTAPVADSGAKKSPPMVAAVEPTLALQREANADYEDALELYEALPKDEKKVETPPKRTRYRVSNTTLESLLLLLHDSKRGLLDYVDELSGLFGSFNQYSRGDADEPRWLELYGARPIVVDRKSSEIPALFIEKPHLCMTGGIQPEILRDSLTAKRLASGFGARLLLAAPPPRPRRWVDSDLTLEVKAAYHNLVRGMYRYPTGPETLKLTPEARQHFIAWVNDNGELIDSLPGGPLKAALSKIEALPARLSLSFYVAECEASGRTPSQISGDAMRRAVKVAAWFRYETARIYDAYGINEGTLSRDERLVAQLPEAFTWEDVADLWKVEKRAAHNIVSRLTEDGLVTKEKHGLYRRCTLHFVHFRDHDPERWNPNRPITADH